MAVMPDRLPLSALLSHALVAYTIEFDNEFEHRMPHRTTEHGRSVLGDGPWLVSLVMWANCMRFVDEQGLTVGELRRLARTGTNLDGMRRWRYLLIDGSRQRVRQPAASAVLQATKHGLAAREAWEPLGGVVEQRWRERFGAASVSGLRDALRRVAGQLDPALPDCMPILKFGLWTSEARLGQAASANRQASRDAPEKTAAAGAARADEAGGAAPGLLWSLLSRVLLSFALEYEQDSAVSLAIGANLLRVLDERPTRIRDLPALSGVSKEAIEMGLGFLANRKDAVVESGTGGSRWRTVRLTERGLRGRDAYHADTADLEEQWRSRFGQEAIAALRSALEPLATVTEGTSSPLLAGLEPYPDSWRARVSDKAGDTVTLPHYPMVLHRGGFPDGS
jgi:hypothetical protein